MAHFIAKANDPRALEPGTDKGSTAVGPKEQQQEMPEICRFLGISIYMYYREHGPPHFHAEYGEFEITVGIESGIVSGRFPRRAIGLVLEWCMVHKAELLADRELAAKKLPLNPISPLE